MFARLDSPVADLKKRARGQTARPPDSPTAHEVLALQILVDPIGLIPFLVPLHTRLPLNNNYNYISKLQYFTAAIYSLNVYTC